MTASLNTTTSAPKRVLMIVANPSVSTTTGWPVGFWASELTHAWYEFTEAGYEITIASPAGGKVELDGLSDPRDPSGYSADDLISLGFLSTPSLVALLEDTPSLVDLDADDYDALVVAGGQSPMFTFRDNDDLKEAIARFYEAEKPTAALCHGVSAHRRHALRRLLPDRGQDDDGLRECGGGRGRPAQRPEGDAVAHRRRSPRARCELRRRRALEAVCGSRRPARHRAAAILRPQGGRARHRSDGKVSAMKIGVIGGGNVGGGLAEIWRRSGHEVSVSTRETVSETASFGEVVVLAVPAGAAADVFAQTSGLDGKVLVDATNNLSGGPGATEIAGLVPAVCTVKAFNTVFASIYDRLETAPSPPTMVYCGDDADAKTVVETLIRDAGFDPVDAGGLETAPDVEAFARLVIGIAYRQGRGRSSTGSTERELSRPGSQPSTERESPGMPRRHVRAAPPA